ncbi:endonuclease I family protein [Solicola gregarius]|uniref:Endonuclease n=1 Tax=Solicola gregarius TaxID=2908642 RepID=A0AA46TMA4_9ACTN|nr:endonuclease [Solicola gregarius]UYM07532.1 endonuclease [Solicola gregarius]
MRTKSMSTALLTIGLVAGLSQVPAAAVEVPEPPASVAVADVPDGYYDGAEGKAGEELRSSLHTIISADVTQLTYDEVWEALKVTDEDPANPANVILLYSGESRSEDANGGDADDWNREHVWAKSHGDFGTDIGPGTDVHHLRPTDVTVNSTRGNLDFDEGGEEVEEAPGNYVDGDSWEPRDEVKGDVARMIMYMDVRYDGENGYPDLEVNDAVDNGSNPNIGKISVLLQWNEMDPPDAFEENRNDVIYDQFQHNRNPFVDHPEWAAAIWG